MPPVLVGASGERKTLRNVAKHADACYLFGSPETIRRKLEVLFDHCKKIGKNYDTIFKIQRCLNKLSNCQLRVKERNGIAGSFYRKGHGRALSEFAAKYQVGRFSTLNSSCTRETHFPFAICY